MPRTSGFNRTIKIVLAIIEMIILHFSFYASFNLRYDFISYQNWNAYMEALPYILVVFVLINILMGMYVLYDKRPIDLFTSTILGQIIVAVFTMALTYLGRWFAFPRTIIFISFFVSVIALTLWRILVLKLYQRTAGSSRVMLIGDSKEVKDAYFNIKTADLSQYKVSSMVIDNFYENVTANIEEADIFYFLDGISANEERKIVSDLIFTKKGIFFAADFNHVVNTNNRIMNIDDESVISVAKFEIPPEGDAIKRFIDIIISLSMLIILSPIMLITALVIKLTSKGPIFYKQTRVTLGNKNFEVFKFRSMQDDAEAESGAVLASDNDPRVTGVGKFIRATRIDELPQLINVLKGDMSLVGPRPERPEFVSLFEEINPYYRLRHTVRAGITGYAQVYGKYSTDFQHKLRFDLTYIKNYSFFLDIKILFQTVRILFDKVSSQGVQEEDVDGSKIPEDIKIYK